MKLALAQVVAVALFLEFAVFEVALSQESETGCVATTKKTLKKLLAGEITKALEDFTCSVPTTAPCTDPAPSLTRIQGTVDRIEDKLDAPSTEPPPPSLTRIEETVERIDSKLNAPSTEPSTLNQIEQAISRMEDKINNLTMEINFIKEQQNKSLDDILSILQAAGSCAEILTNYPSSLSGYYWVKNATGHPHRVYCDMTRSCGGVTGGWMRVAYLDMTNSNHQCPSSLRQRTDYNVRTCAPYEDTATCSSVYYSSGTHYSKICGKIRAFRFGTMDGFLKNDTIDSIYVDGISITHGRAPRRHIWTFAVNHQGCSCEKRQIFVGNDYFCEAGKIGTIDLNNPLWDGQCGSNHCCTVNNPPWFYRQLSRSTTDDIEMRACRNYNRYDEDVLIEEMEIFVQ